MNFDREEKLAIIKLLEKVAKADNKIMEEEMKVLLNAAKYLGLGEQEILESKEIPLVRAGEVLKGMDEEKQELISSTLLRLMIADGMIQSEEVQIVMDTFFGKDRRY